MNSAPRPFRLDPTVGLWLAVGAAGYVLLPWYAIEDGFFGFDWLFQGYPNEVEAAPVLFLNIGGHKPWLWPLLGFLLLPLATWGAARNSARFSAVLFVAGGGGFAYLLVQAPSHDTANSTVNDAARATAVGSTPAWKGGLGSSGK